MAEESRPMRDVGGVGFEYTGGASVRLAPVPARAMLNLRPPPDERRFAAAVHEVLGVALPADPNRWNGHSDRAIVWLGPDEWLVMAPDGQAGEIEERLRESIGDDPWLSVVDVSHSYVGFELSGPAARDVLAKGCPLDLHPRSFGPGDCAQSLLAKARVLLRATERENCIEIWVRNSFAGYTATWLIDSMEEFTEFARVAIGLVSVAPV